MYRSIFGLIIFLQVFSVFASSIQCTNFFYPENSMSVKPLPVKYNQTVYIGVYAMLPQEYLSIDSWGFDITSGGINRLADHGQQITIRCVSVDGVDCEITPHTLAPIWSSRHIGTQAIDVITGAATSGAQDMNFQIAEQIVTLPDSVPTTVHAYEPWKFEVAPVYDETGPHYDAPPTLTWSLLSAPTGSVITTADGIHSGLGDPALITEPNSVITVSGPGQPVGIANGAISVTITCP